ncbi:MAG: hypothetical protein ACLFVJ_23670 [Persicimonas sp.]
MAITPRTILSHPLNLLLFGLGVLGVGGLIGLFVCAGEVESQRHAAPVGAVVDELDAGLGPASDAGSAASASDRSRSASAYQDYACQLEQPDDGWSEGQWLRHIDCMEARSEHYAVLLAETNEAIEAAGLSVELAVLKADYLEVEGSPDEHIAFLEQAYAELGVVDGRLAHRLSRALVWRGQAEDVERVRHLQLLSRTLLDGSCEVLQTDIWARFLMAEELAGEGSPAAWRGVRDAIDTYLINDCQQQRHTGKWGALAEIIGVGVAAEMSNGHDGHSSLFRQVTDAFDIHQQRTFCRRAVPDRSEWRDHCRKRVGDELYLSRD